ncbi:substrate-binding periplasmic protein [Bdellovibrio sp. HCB2-146]|uniref:substrate-binding periplasmic protein n=1 Tax=Bdellovibrio sp. HCB2-146 TaxID=3394362 RepID=UPI0039BD1B6D
MSVLSRVLILAFLIVFSQASFAKQVVRITTGEWAPYISESIDQKGLITQITKEAFAKKNIDVEIGFFPWARATELSKSGEWDATIAFARLKEREKFYLFSRTLYIGRYAFFHLKSQPFFWTGYEDLKEIKMASTRGFGGMGDDFLKAERSGVITVMRLTSDVQSFNMLKANRVQAVPSDLEAGYVLLHKIYGKEANLFTHNPRLIQSSDYHLVVSKKNKNAQKIIDTFNEGLMLLHSSGRYDEILKTWYNKPIYRQSVPPEYLPAPKVTMRTPAHHRF